MIDLQIGFTGQPLDRADHIRNDPAALAALKDERALLLLLEGLDPVMDDENRLQWGSLADAGDAELVFLGLMEGRVCFAPIPAAGEGGPLNMGASIRRVMGGMPASDMAIYGMARSVVDWHARHRFCAQCGSPTAPTKGGWQRNCRSCKAEHFPRVDPVTIMLVESTRTSKSAGSKTDRDGGFSLTPPATGPFSFLSPEALTASGTSNFKGQGTATQTSSLSGQLSVTIAEVRPNGTALVRGQKLLNLSQGQEWVQFSGIVRLSDLDEDSRIVSTRVADARIVYSGKGSIQRAGREGWLSRFFNMITPF